MTSSRRSWMGFRWTAWTPNCGRPIISIYAASIQEAKRVFCETCPDWSSDVDICEFSLLPRPLGKYPAGGAA